jgi:hypothetical protein
MLLGCITFPLLSLPLRLLKRDEPLKADPIPPGYVEAGRFDVKGRNHVIFKKGKRWRLYIDGRFDYEGVEK